MESKGTLEPVDRRDVYVQTENSVVEELMVNHKDLVEAGQLLVQLRSTKLQNETTTIQGELASTKKAINSIQRDLRRGQTHAPIGRNRLQGEMAEKREKLESLEKQLDLCQKQPGGLIHQKSHQGPGCYLGSSTSACQTAGRCSAGRC